MFQIITTNLTSIDSTYHFAPWTWQPIFNVNKTYGETATLMLISNYGISYPGESLDPIFPANKDYGDGWYYNTQFHASVFGCMSRTIVCLPETTPLLCFNLTGLGKLDDIDREHSSVRSLLYFSLIPDLHVQLGYLQAEALDAQSLLSGSTSSKLSDSQWKAEARQMFESLLARTQITARNIARGVPGEELPGQESLMKPEYQGMCTRYKFRTIGWKNVSVSRFLAEFFAGLMVFVVGITKENRELWVEEPVRRIAKSRVGKLCASGMMVLGAVCAEYGPRARKTLCSIAGWCWLGIYHVGRRCWDGIATGVAWVRHTCRL